MRKYKLIRSKRKSISIKINEKASLEVRAPFHISQEEIDSFVNSKEEWIAKHTKEISEKYNCVCVLKGRRTVITDGKKVFINPTGNSALAKAGTGDVLAGITAGLFVQLIKQNAEDAALKAACAGVYLHGLCADIALKDYGAYSVMASDLNKYLGRAIKNVKEK